MVETKLAHLSVHLIPQRQGGHTWVGVFAGKDEDHRSKCGELAFRNEEWDLLSDVIAHEYPLSADLDLVVDPVKESNDG